MNGGATCHAHTPAKGGVRDLRRAGCVTVANVAQSAAR